MLVVAFASREDEAFGGERSACLEHEGIATIEFVDFLLQIVTPFQGRDATGSWTVGEGTLHIEARKFCWTIKPLEDGKSSSLVLGNNVSLCVCRPQ
jgi:hypothetical protein